MFVINFIKKLIEWLQTIPLAANIALIIALIALITALFVIVLSPCPSEVSVQKIENYLSEIDDIEQNWGSRWQDIEPLAERAKSYIDKCFPEQASKIADALAGTDANEVARELQSQLQVVHDNLSK